MGIREREKVTLGRMISLYCRLKHGAGEVMCEECSGLLEYACRRLERCPYGDRKGVCRKCVSHCYNREMRGRIKEVMRFSGPRMLWYYPMDFMRHMAGR